MAVHEGVLKKARPVGVSQNELSVVQRCTKCVESVGGVDCGGDRELAKWVVASVTLGVGTVAKEALGVVSTVVATAGGGVHSVHGAAVP